MYFSQKLYISIQQTWYNYCEKFHIINGGIDMKAYEYLKPGHAQLTDKEKPTITSSTDAIIRIVKTTICGTDLHIIKGDTPEVKSHTTLGHEGIGIIEEIGDNVNNFKVEIK